MGLCVGGTPNAVSLRFCYSRLKYILNDHSLQMVCKVGSMKFHTAHFMVVDFWCFDAANYEIIYWDWY